MKNTASLKKRTNAKSHDADPKAKLNAAFRALRSQGFIARQGFKCCNGCAFAAVDDELKAMPAGKRDKLRGLVFYHLQDAEKMFDRWGNFDGTYLTFDSIEPHVKVADRGREITAIGREIAAVMKASGLKVTWAGTGATRIFVYT